MKICFWHFYTFRLRRGIETLVVSLANALAKKGEDVSIVTASPHFELFVKPDPSVKVCAYPTFRYFEHITIAPFYYYHFKKHAYDRVVTFFSDFGEGLTTQLLKPLQLPLVLYLCYPYSNVPHRYRSFQKYGWDRQEMRVLAVSEWVAKEAGKIFKQPVSILPVGTDSELIRPNPENRRILREKAGYTSKDIVLLNVAALEKRKGAWRVLEVMSRMKDRFPNLKYYILGKGEHENELKNMTARLGLSDRVIFAGETSQHPMFYNMADIFVMLPDAEANSLAFHEAMSAGMPMLVSDTPGFRESSDEKSVLYADPGDLSKVEKVLEQLISDPHLRDSLGKAGRQYIQDHCTWSKIADTFLRLIQ